MADRPEEETTDAGRELQAANLFDLRRIIGALFVVYGLILVVTGVGDSDAEIAKAADIHINLWAGLGMLLLGAFFLAWGFLRPLGRQLAEAQSDDQSSRAPAEGTSSSASEGGSAPGSHSAST